MNYGNFLLACAISMAVGAGVGYIKGSKKHDRLVAQLQTNAAIQRARADAAITDLDNQKRKQDEREVELQTAMGQLIDDPDYMRECVRADWLHILNKSLKDPR